MVQNAFIIAFFISLILMGGRHRFLLGAGLLLVVAMVGVALTNRANSSNPDQGIDSAFGELAQSLYSVSSNYNSAVAEDIVLPRARASQIASEAIRHLYSKKLSLNGQQENAFNTGIPFDV